MLAALVLLFVGACAPRLHEARPLRFSAPEGAVLNEFFRQGRAAAHLVLSSGSAPRIVFAFPAGNSGAAVWFDAASALTWQAPVTMRAEQRAAAGHVWHGVSAELKARGGAIRIRQAILSSVRVIRAYAETGVAPSEVLTPPRVSRNEIVWQRRRLDGAPGYSLSLRVLRGAVVGPPPGSARDLELAPAADGSLQLRLTALTADLPLTPIDEAHVLTASAPSDLRLRRVLAFLSYEEKLLAGSWRFNTYFGRDTLMTLVLLAPVAQAPLLEAGLGAVLERMSASGEVAHEEDVGEYAILRRVQAGLPASAAALLDYKMVDDDFMLALVAERSLLGPSLAALHASAFLARRTGAGVTYGALLVRNLCFVVASAAPFARAPQPRHLVSLKPSERTGNWRDSEDGLGGGRYPYDVNGVLVPAALEAIGRLAHSRVLGPYLDAETKRTLLSASALAAVWQREAPPLFDVEVPAPAARAAAEGYARSVGVEPAAALAALGPEALRFRAVALDDQGRPVPILSSDESLALLLRTPESSEVERIVRTLTRAFPAGLMTDVGLVVANPAYASDALAQRFGRNRYHGTVIWSWQQGVLAAALKRQLARLDLTATARTTLIEASARLRAAMAAAEVMRGAELWSWSAEQGRYRVEPFGQRAADETEANAAQLWSTIDLAR